MAVIIFLIIITPQPITVAFAIDDSFIFRKNKRFKIAVLKIGHC